MASDNLGTVYISSTFSDLLPYRNAAHLQLEKLELKPLSMEAYSAEERRPIERCLQDVRRSDLYVGIFAWRYGAIPPGRDHSYTELEYREAGKHNVERLIFLLEPGASWFPNFMDAHVHGNDKSIRRLREELEQTHLCSYFTTPESFAGELSAAVQRFLKRRVVASAVSDETSGLAAAAIKDYAQSILAELEPELDRHYVSLDKTIEDTQIIDDRAADLRGLRPHVFTVLDHHLQSYRSGTPQSPVAKLADDLPQQFVLLADPGGGKTTFLQNLQMEACRRLLREPGAPVPLLVRLTQWPEGILDLDSLLVHERTVQALQMVPTRRLLVLLDELNEVDGSTYETKVGAIRDWARSHPSIPLVVASRHRSYEQGPEIALPRVRLEPLDETRVATFLRTYLGDRADALLPDLLWESRPSDAVRRPSILAGNPFILRVFCYIYECTGQAPPPSRGQMFRMLVATLYERERRKGKTRDVSLAFLSEASSAIAMAMIRTGSSTSVHRDFAIKHLPSSTNPLTLMKLMEDVSLIRTAKHGRFVQFNHQMLLEYFAAEYLNADPTRIKHELPKPRLGKKRRIPHAIDEVLLLLLDLTGPRTVIPHVIGRDPYLAAELLKDFDSDDEIHPQLIQDVLENVSRRLDIRNEQTAATDALAALGERGVSALRTLLLHEHKWVRRAVVRALAEVGSKQAVEAIFQALDDDDRWVRRDAASALAALQEPSRAHLEAYLHEAISGLSLEERDAIGQQLLDAVAPTDSELRNLTMKVFGLEEELPAPPRDESSMASGPVVDHPPEEELARIRRSLVRCSDALQKGLNTGFAGHLLIKTLNKDSLPDDVRQHLINTSIRWLQVNWAHGWFSPILDALLRVTELRPDQRTELVTLLTRRFWEIRPGRAAGRRNRVLLRLLGEVGEIPEKAVQDLVGSLVRWMDNGKRRGVISCGVMRRLKADLPPGDPMRGLLEKAASSMEAIKPLDPGPIPTATQEVRELIKDAFALAQAMVTAEAMDLDAKVLESLLTTVERLQAYGHLYRCRHVVARLLALSDRCPDGDLRERAVTLARCAATDETFTDNQRSLFSSAMYTIIDKGYWVEAERAESLVASLGFARASAPSEASHQVLPHLPD